MPRSLVLATLLAFAPAVSAQLSPIVGLWPLDATSGTFVADNGPYASHGTLMNAGAAPWVVGQLGNALQLDGTDDYVALPTSADLPVYRRRGAPFSIAFWVNAPAQSDRRVYSEQAANPTGLGPLFTLGSGSTAAGATGRLRVYIRTDAAVVAVDVTSTAIVFDNTWHHVTYVDDVGRIRIYVDGVLDTAVDYSRWSYGPAGTLAGSYQGIDSVTLGAVVRNGAVSAPLAGTVDDVQVYRAVLDAADIAAIRVGGQPNLVVASLGAYGQGCGTGPLDMIATGSAALGGTVWLEAVRGEPNGVLLLGLCPGLVSPFDLGAVGYPGCTLYLPTLQTVVAGVVGPSGSGAPLAIPIPVQPTFNGLFFSAQWFNVAATTIEASPAAVLQLGR